MRINFRRVYINSVRYASCVGGQSSERVQCSRLLHSLFDFARMLWSLRPDGKSAKRWWEGSFIMLMVFPMHWSVQPFLLPSTSRIYVLMFPLYMKGWTKGNSFSFLRLCREWRHFFALMGRFRPPAPSGIWWPHWWSAGVCLLRPSLKSIIISSGFSQHLRRGCTTLPEIQPEYAVDMTCIELGILSCSANTLDIIPLFDTLLWYSARPKGLKVDLQFCSRVPTTNISWLFS